MGTKLARRRRASRAPGWASRAPASFPAVRTRLPSARITHSEVGHLVADAATQRGGEAATSWRDTGRERIGGGLYARSVVSRKLYAWLVVLSHERGTMA